MEITGRVTADAKLNVLPGDRQVVNFTIIINDYYRPKGSNEIKQLTTYIKCSYWQSGKLAEHLTKGAVVQVYGRLGVYAYTDMDGNPKGSITLHCKTVKILATSKKEFRQDPPPVVTPVYIRPNIPQHGTNDEVPF